VGGILGIVYLHRHIGGRWIWSYLIVGSFAWTGINLPSSAASAAEATIPAAPAAPPALATGEPTFPGARVPGTDEPTYIQGGWSFSGTGGADIGFTDNVYLTNAERRGDIIVSPHGSLTVRRATARSVVNADVNVVYDYYTNNTRLNGVRPSALLDSFASLIENTFTIDARLATDVQPTSNEDRVPAFERNLERNQTQVLNYGISPTLRGRIGGGVSAEATYDYSGVTFLDPPVGDTPLGNGDMTRHFARGEIGNTDVAGAPLVWSASGSYERAYLEFLNQRPERANGEGRVEYRMSSSTAVMARGGYDWIEEPTLITPPDGAYGLAGVIWRPSLRTQARAEVGYRYGGFNAEGEVLYQASAAVILSASYVRDIQTTQRILLSNLAGLGRDEFGNLIDPITGLPPNPNGIRFGVSNQAFQRDRFRVGMHGRLARNFYSVSADYERRAANGLDGRSWGGRATVGRDITPRLQGSLSASHLREKSDPGLTNTVLDSKTTSAGARVDYALTPTVRTSLRYMHMRRETTLVKYRENALVLSLSKTF
jgi:uncharacterized protein (PEP-CTERM system associated)